MAAAPHDVSNSDLAVVPTCGSTTGSAYRRQDLVKPAPRLKKMSSGIFFAPYRVVRSDTLTERGDGAAPEGERR
jgi:hypothetical protein